MTDYSLRVAFFPDAYNEIDGVANTARQFEAFALRRNLAFLTVCGGTENAAASAGSTQRITRRRGKFGFALDKKHDFDLAFWRHLHSVEETVRAFHPDILHITGPSDIGQLGVAIAHRLRIPLAASWHTNVHEYAQQRAERLLSFLPANLQRKLGEASRQGSLMATLRFYHIAQLLFAPNSELIQMIEKGTGKSCYPMHRGVDTELFNPAKRNRKDSAFVIGYVGRLTVEKNIRFLAELEQTLIDSGSTNFKFLIVGQGSEESWLKANLRSAEFTGVLKGEALAQAYANMDVFAFPSRTDTYGNVVLEALASGVPAVVTDGGGPKYIIRPNQTGFIARNLSEFVAHIQTLMAQPELLQATRTAARAQAISASWDTVFDSVYVCYERSLRNCNAVGKKIRMRPHSVST